MGLTVTKNEANNEEGRVSVVLSGPADIGEMAAIKSALLDALRDCEEMLLDVSEVSVAHPALLQLIHAARSSALKAGINFVLVGDHTAAFGETMISAGFVSLDNNDNASAQAFLKE